MKLPYAEVAVWQEWLVLEKKVLKRGEEGNQVFGWMPVFMTVYILGITNPQGWGSWGQGAGLVMRTTSPARGTRGLCWETLQLDRSQVPSSFRPLVSAHGHGEAGSTWIFVLTGSCEERVGSRLWIRKRCADARSAFVCTRRCADSHGQATGEGVVAGTVGSAGAQRGWRQADLQLVSLLVWSPLRRGTLLLPAPVVCRCQPPTALCYFLKSYNSPFYSIQLSVF